MRTVLIIILLVPAFTFAQTDKKAMEFFTAGNFDAAIPEFQALLDYDQHNASYNYMMGVCYLNTGGDKSRAIPYLERIKDDKSILNRLYMLARAYHYGYRFKEAIALFEQFLAEGKGNAENLASVPTYIQYCINAQEVMKYPVNVTIENMGPEINTSYAEYFPFIPKDESLLIFNSRRGDKSLEKPNGEFASNVYLSKEAQGKFGKPVFLEGVNTYDYDEEVVGLSSDGATAIYFMQSLSGDGELFMGSIAGGVAAKAEKLPRAINTKHHEIAACISREGEEIYFASDMPGGMGGVDLYVVRRLPNGEWSQPLNLGPAINTPFDEDFPNLSPDGKYLFFSSKGHSSMGGYDIFRAEWDSQKLRFGAAENMRFPINTPDDNLSFMLSESGRYGYMSAIRKEGYGDLDIYRVTFNEVEPRLTLVTGQVSSTNTKEKFEEVLLTVTDMETGEIFGDYRPNRNSWKYVMILPPGKYQLEIYADNHEVITEEITIQDKSSFRTEIKKDYLLKKID
jgi:hypothetical protein